MTPNRCRSCGATVEWRLLKGMRHPFNPDGTSHFASCPQADAWRGERGSREAARAARDAAQGRLFGEEDDRASH